MVDLRAPNHCPDEPYIKDTLYSLLQRRFDDKEHLLSAQTLYLRRPNLGRLLSLYEAYKRVVDLPGSVVELGVFKGESLLLFGKLMELMNPSDRSCGVVGFDNFKGFTALNVEDGGENPQAGRVVGGWSSENYHEDLLGLINVFDHDRMVGQKARIELVEGDINETVPRYVQENPGLRIRLLHLDCDLYEPTLTGLKYLYDKVVKGGIVILDEYAFKEFPGESKAVEDFFGKDMPLIKKFPYYSNPGGYFIK